MEKIFGNSPAINKNKVTLLLLKQITTQYCLIKYYIPLNIRITPLRPIVNVSGNN